MKRTTTTLTILAFAAAALAGCSAAPEDTASAAADNAATGTTANAAPVSNIAAADENEDAAEDDLECTEPATISRLGYRSNPPIDVLGPTDYASGEVTYDADGKIESYTAVEGDTLMGISDRFCFDFAAVSQLVQDTSGFPLKPGAVIDFGKPQPWNDSE